MIISEYLFRGFSGCSNHDCIINRNPNVGTNGTCKCLLNMNRSELSILSSRLSTIADVELPPKENE